MHSPIYGTATSFQSSAGMAVGRTQMDVISAFGGPLWVHWVLTFRWNSGALPSMGNRVCLQISTGYSMDMSSGSHVTL